MKKFFLLAVAAVAMNAFATDAPATGDLYIVGDKVNDVNSWTNGDPSLKFENKGNGVYEWNGTYLGSGFKITDGTWDYELASNGEGLALGEPYAYAFKGGNVSFADCSGVNNPKVVVNLNEETMTITGKADGAVEWFFTGDFNGWALAIVMNEIEDDVYQVKGVDLPEAGEFKVATTGWGKQFGAPGISEGTEYTPISNEALTAELGEVGSVDGYPFELTAGKYDITWDYNTNIVTFAAASETGVAGVAVDGVEAVYYNLQGVKVNNPKNGIFVKVAGKKATKVVVAE